MSQEDTPDRESEIERELEMNLTREAQLQKAVAMAGFEPNYRLTVHHPLGEHHRHVAIAWSGGVLWLDLMDLTDHHCVDVRQIRDGEQLPLGVMGMAGGTRCKLDDSNVREEARQTNHGWPAVQLLAVLTDKPNDEEGQA